MHQLTFAQLDALSAAARASVRGRANHNMHPDLPDPIQRLAIAMEPATYVQPHRHPHTFELLWPLRGRFVVLHFDDHGRVLARTVLGEQAQLVETPAGVWHAVRSLDAGGVIFEVKHGPYQPLPPADLAPWSPRDGDGAIRLNDWYVQATAGDVAPYT
jgi:cupin fold WbuC family metalloprotein